MSKKYFNYALWLIFISFLSTPSFAHNQDKNTKRFSLKLGSYVHHLNNDTIDYNESFDNALITLGMKVNASSEVVVGSFYNSYGDRCFLLGLGKNWHNFNSKLSFEGLYAYVGEFFLSQFDNCNHGGVYQKIHHHTGIGFAPYIYHGVKYRVTSILSLEFGILLPQILVGTMRWEF